MNYSGSGDDSLFIRNVIFSNNKANGSGQGGGLIAQSGKIYIYNSLSIYVYIKK